MADESLDEDLDLGAGKQAKPWKKIIIIALAVLLLLGLGGGLTWFLVSPGDETAATEEGQAAEEEPKPPAIYHALDHFVVNLPPGERAKLLQVEMEVMVRSPELVEFLKHNDPMIRHKLLELLGTRKGSELRDRAGKEKLQADALAAIQGIVTELGGPGEVEAVYFTNFVMQ
jgi:flagellar FliL protein